ncbi:MAG: YDG domain-containing protein, partial [Paludibacteraceae bacterium]|nr:YDG domain-containing protein [Paludibacteraceae bacterium]
GTDAANYTLSGQPTGLTASITASSTTLTITGVTVSNKVYDGTTTATLTGGTLVGVNPGDVVTLVAGTGVFSDKNVGTGKTVTVSGYTLSGANAGNYTVLQPTGLSANITAVPLTITDPTITLSKLYDGTTTAAVTAGTLSGVLSADVANVTLTATGRYDNANVGTGKTITVSYSLSGSAAGNYIAPIDFVVTNGVITDNIILSQLVTLSASCEGSDMDLSYNVLKGVPTQYKLSFNDTAHAAGIQDIAYTNLASSATSGTITFAIPSGTADGTYQGTLVVRNTSGTESSSYSFNFTVNVSSDYIVQMYSDVVTCNNNSNRFTAYQWYKDGVAISGATKQFYYQNDGLNGSYSIRLTTTDGQILYTCPKALTSTSFKSASVYPNPAKSNQPFTIALSGFVGEELENATLSIYAINGSCVYQSTKVENLNTINLSLLPQVYIGHLKVSNGSDYEFKVIVEK